MDSEKAGFYFHQGLELISAGSSSLNPDPVARDLCKVLLGCQGFVDLALRVPAFSWDKIYGKHGSIMKSACDIYSYDVHHACE